jgi:hypothetical protein
MVGTDRRAVRAHAKVLRKRLFLRAALSPRESRSTCQRGHVSDSALPFSPPLGPFIDRGQDKEREEGGGG